MARDDELSRLLRGGSTLYLCRARADSVRYRCEASARHLGGAIRSSAVSRVHRSLHCTVGTWSRQCVPQAVRPALSGPGGRERGSGQCAGGSQVILLESFSYTEGPPIMYERRTCDSTNRPFETQPRRTLQQHQSPHLIELGRADESSIRVSGTQPTPRARPPRAARPSSTADPRRCGGRVGPPGCLKSIPRDAPPPPASANTQRAAR